MSIVAISGPHLPDQPPLADARICRLWEKAQAAGMDFEWHPCADFAEVANCLASCNATAELVMLDVDAAELPDASAAPVRDALAALRAPYIEVHDRTGASDVSTLVPGHPSMVSVVIPGDPAAGYAMARTIGLRYLADTTRLAA